MAVPLPTASLSQRAHIQYIVVLLTNSEAMTTNSAHGMTVRISHNMCKTERIRGMANLRRLGRLWGGQSRFMALQTCLKSAIYSVSGLLRILHERWQLFFL